MEIEDEDEDKIGLDQPIVAPPEVWAEFQKQLDADAEQFRAIVSEHFDRIDKAENIAEEV